MTGPVIVGIDGSQPGMDAVERGAVEARLHGASLVLLHVFEWSPPPGFSLKYPEPTEAELREMSEPLLSRAASRAAETAPELHVSTEVVRGNAVTVLLERCREAVVTVVGARGNGSSAGLTLGSVPTRLAAHGCSPLLVLRGRPGPTGPVVVGIDGSPEAESATAWAFAEAAARGVPLRAVHTWSEWTIPATPPRDPKERYARKPGELRADEERLLAEAVSGWSGRYPDVEVERHSVRARARTTLIEESTAAQLMVVGARGRGPLRSLMLGSVSQAVLHHADCPVAVVRNQRPS